MNRIFCLAALLLAFASCKKVQETKNIAPYYKKNSHVGDIIFDPKLDPAPSSFMPCHASYSYQYYNFESNGVQYTGEKPQLMKELMDNYHPPSTPKESCFLTVRFLVNCNGKTGWYRTTVFDHEYQPTKISIELKDAVQTAVKALKSWETKFSNSRNKTMDYHQYLTIRIRDNQIISVVP